MPTAPSDIWLFALVIVATTLWQNVDLIEILVWVAFFLVLKPFFNFTKDCKLFTDRPLKLFRNKLKPFELSYLNELSQPINLNSISKETTI